MPRFVGETYPVGLSRDNLAAAARRARFIAAQMRAEGHQIRFVKSTYMPAEDSLICLFDATSADLVLELGCRAELPIERIVEGVDLMSQPKSTDVDIH